MICDILGKIEDVHAKTVCQIGVDGGSVNYEKDCMCNAMYSACI